MLHGHCSLPGRAAPPVECARSRESCKGQRLACVVKKNRANSLSARAVPLIKHSSYIHYSYRSFCASGTTAVQHRALNHSACTRAHRAGYNAWKESYPALAKSSRHLISSPFYRNLVAVQHATELNQDSPCAPRIRSNHPELKFGEDGEPWPNFITPVRPSDERT